MVKYWRRGLLVLFELFCKGSARFSNVFFSTPFLIALVSIYDFTHPVNGIIVLRIHKEAFDGLASFKMYLYPIFAACFLDSLTEALMIRNQHIQVLIVVVSWALLIGSSVFVSVGFLALQFCSFYDPCGVFTFL